jgi:hypothetical protein
VILKRLIRAAAIFACIGCMVLSLRFIIEIGAAGDAIGAWIGLPGHEKAIVEARAQSHTAMLRLLLVQVAGGIFAFFGFRRQRIGIRWSPLFLVAFPISTFVVFILIVGLAEIIQPFR